MKKNFFEQYPLAKHLLYMLGISLVVLVVVFLLIKVYARQGKEYEMPDLCGRLITEVEDDNPLRLRYVVIDSVYNKDAAGGEVVMQDPKPGTMIKTRRKVYVTITAYNPSEVVLPELSNMTVRSAVSALQAAGLTCGRLRFVDSPYKNVILECYSKGKLIYAGEKIGQGAVIDLTVGLGESHASTMVPFVIGQTQAKVRRGLLSASLNVGSEHFDNVSNRSTAVCYRLEPDYTGVSRYPLGTAVEVWYCDASEADVERIISNFKVDSSKIGTEEHYGEVILDDVEPDYDDDWDW